MKKVFDKVNIYLERYIGGEVFFDELDKMVKFDKEVLVEFIDTTQEQFKEIHTIASGEFGLCLHNYGLTVDLLVQGGLRKGNQICDLSQFIKKGRKLLVLR